MMSIRCPAVILLWVVACVAAPASGQVASYEATSLPNEDGWDVIQLFCDPEVWIQDGWLFEDLQMCEGTEPPTGQTAVYRRSLAGFIGVDAFFVEWVVETTAEQSEQIYGGGANISAWSHGGVNYTFFIVRDDAKLNRDNLLPVIHVDIKPGMPHHYRLALFGSELYVWYVDGVMVDSGVPEGPYPSANPNMNLYAAARFLPNLTTWDYVRYGTIPAPGSGDFQSDGEVGPGDLYYFQECFSTPAGSWAGCAWADMDFSGGVDCTDWALFLAAWTDPADPPCMLGCDCNPADLDGDGDVDSADLAELLVRWGSTDPCPPLEPADLDGDCDVDTADLAELLNSWG